MLLTCLFWGIYRPSWAIAQQPTATIVSLTGEVSVSVQGGSPNPGTIGMILQEGDSIRTRAGANTVVELSDRSTLELAENTAVSISVLTEDPATGASRSHLDLWWGNLRSVLPSGQAAAHSSLTIQTSNARTDMGISADSVGSDAEVSYNPNIDTTIAVANKFDVVVTNLLTEESLLVPEGNVGIVQESTVQRLEMAIYFPEGDDSLAEIIKAQGEGEHTIKAQLDRIAIVLTQIPNKTIFIEGHTDNIGTDEANKQLGQRRADNVKQYFIEHHGIDPERLKTVSYGMTKPVESNETETGRAKNRRVEVH